MLFLKKVRHLCVCVVVTQPCPTLWDPTNCSPPGSSAWRIPGTGEPGGLPFMRSHRVRHDWSDLASKQGRVLGLPVLGDEWKLLRKTAKLRIASLKHWRELFKNKVNFIVGKRAPFLKTLFVNINAVRRFSWLLCENPLDSHNPVFVWGGDRTRC